MHLGVHSQRQPGKVAYQMAGTGHTVTYLELDQRSNQGAHYFRHLGLRARDGIAVLLDNHPAYLQICWAAQRSGLYYTPISTLFAQQEIQYIVANSDIRVLITQHRLLTQLDHTALGDIRILLVDDDGNGWPNWYTETGRFPVTEIPDPYEGAEMIYSSGTTGKPKGVRFDLALSPPGTISELMRTRITMHQISETTRYLSTAPLYHSAPLRYNMMVTRLGGSCVIMEKFDAQRSLELIEQFAISHSQWVPTMFVRLLKLAPEIKQAYCLASLQYAIHAAAPCPIHIKQQMIDWWGPILYEYYSGTEANGSTAISSADWLTHQGSVGQAIHGEIHILDEDGLELPQGETGTVFFANGSDFSYYKDAQKTAAARNAAGWSTLGDMGFVDEQGYLYLRDRKSFMIISGGVNIYPQEIEDALIRHEDVLDAAVFGVPDEEFGEAVKAVVQLNDAGSASAEKAEQLIKHCRNLLAHLKCPRSIDFMENLPRHPTGKLYKHQLRDPYWRDHNSRII